MSFSSGFFNSVSHDRKYNATEMSQLFDGLITDGVYEKIGNCFIVKEYDSNIVSVGTGRAWFNGTWSFNDSLMLVEMGLSDQLLPRIDAIVLEVNQSSDVRANSIAIVEGTAASSPVNPTLKDSGDVHQYPLAYIRRAANSNTISQSDITNTVGTSDCPFVAGIVDQDLVIDELLLQWTDQYEKYLIARENDFDAWFANLKDLIDENIATKLTSDVLDLQSGKENLGVVEDFVLSTSKWVSDNTHGAMYSYSLTTKTEVTEDDKIMISLNEKSSAISDSVISNCQSAVIALVTVTGSNQVTLYAYGTKKPTVSIPISIEIIKRS